MKMFRVAPMIDLPQDAVVIDDDTVPATARRRIGDILAGMLNLSSAQIEQIAARAPPGKLRFGEAAMQLGLASPDHVLAALAQQFDYPCMPGNEAGSLAELLVLSRPLSPQAEAVRAIRSQVLRAQAHANPGARALAVVSPDSGDGKTYLAANLAVALAQAGTRTLLLDADMRHPRQHEVFGLHNASGLSALLLDGAGAPSVKAVGGVPGLYVLPAGVMPPNPLELIERPAFDNLLGKLASRFDHVIVDTPAAIFGADAQVIAERCGATLLVARRNASRLSRLQALIAAVSEPPQALVGMVMNDF